MAASGARQRRRARLVRAPLTIGEPAPAVTPRLADAEPYRPDSIADGGTALGLLVRAASVRGLSKRYHGDPRQDDLCLRVHEPSRTLVVAVADGVSGAPRSDLAAALAVRHAAAAVTRQLDEPDASLDWRAVFEQAAWALVEEHRRHSGDGDAGVAQAGDSLATTLVVAAVTAGADEVRVRLAAVGDSPAFNLLDGRYVALLGAADDEAPLLDPTVQALPRATRATVEAEHALEPGSVLLVCTDGLALPLGGGAGEVGATLAVELRRPPDILGFARLLDFSRSTYDDDRTLVAVWVPA